MVLNFHNSFLPTRKLQKFRLPRFLNIWDANQPAALILNVTNPTGKFWDGVGTAGDNFDIIGGAICGAILVFGVGSVILYGPWRRRYDRRRAVSSPEPSEPEENGHDPEAGPRDFKEIKGTGDVKSGRSVVGSSSREIV